MGGKQMSRGKAKPPLKLARKPLWLAIQLAKVQWQWEAFVKGAANRSV